MKLLPPMLSIIVLIYLIGWAVHLVHFHAKFEECHATFVNASPSDQWVYRRASAFAHEDSARAPFWPLITHRWNVDYVEEARRLDR